MKFMESAELKSTKDYSMFERMKHNRPVDLNRSKVRNLRRSMKKHGWLPSCPAKIRKKEDGSFVIDDGQHRIALAEEYGLKVYYVIDNTPIDIAAHQDTSSKWNPSDVIHHYTVLGNEDYEYLGHFKERYKLPISACIGLLADASHFNNRKFRNGEFEIVDKNKANKTAQSALEIDEIKSNAGATTSMFIRALIDCRKVDQFDIERFVAKCESHSHLLEKRVSKSDYLEVFQEVYNYKARENDRIPLKFLAKQA